MPINTTRHHCKKKTKTSKTGMTIRTALIHRLFPHSSSGEIRDPSQLGLGVWPKKWKNLCCLCSVAEIKDKRSIDVMGVAADYNENEVSTAQGPRRKCSFTLRDQTKTMIVVTIWRPVGDKENFSDQLNGKAVRIFGFRLPNGCLVKGDVADADFIQNNFEHHQIEPEEMKLVDYRKVWAWIVADPMKYIPPRTYTHQQGCVIWNSLGETKFKPKVSVTAVKKRQSVKKMTAGAIIVTGGYNGL